ncbi:hypothetical protein FRD01_17500 [Microvenator marinus]|uniref:Uncharacterized protein n=1 Tax=Microvenator marinus TaxID=2600177 RepID=A0A5B8XUY2_9DELT|nr:hypothetical protein [Microvenator marinus]QED29001.1 hypothetical protein FRD01_17500 [Microvenator marinus]
MRRLILLVLLSAACDAQRPPCADSDDCFVGELCSAGVCVAAPEPEPDMPRDMPEDQSPDLPPDTRDCRINTTVCLPQACNQNTGRCFACEFNAQCGTNALCNAATGECTCEPGTHRCGNQCVSNDADETCGDRCEPCPGTANGFGFCEAETCEIGCNPDFFRCDETCDVTELECAECLENSHCPDDEPVCDAGVCKGCRSDADCTARDGLSVCSDGACVECTEDKKTACDGNTCNPATNTCTETLIASVETCGFCVSRDACRYDSEDCVPMKFRGVDRPGGYCLYRSNEFACGRPYGIRVERTPIGETTPQTYCTINEDELTCEALRGYGDYCDEDAECGVPGLNDGLCRTFTGSRRCTYACDTNDDCVPPFQTVSCVTYCRDL